MARKRKHVPPSRLRYEYENPTVSVRVSRQLFEELRALKARSGKGVGDVLREAIGAQAATVGDAYQHGFRDGSRRTMAQYRVDYRCSGCGGTLTVTAKAEKQAVAAYMREHGWKHRDCMER